MLIHPNCEALSGITLTVLAQFLGQPQSSIDSHKLFILNNFKESIKYNNKLYFTKAKKNGKKPKVCVKNWKTL